MARISPQPTDALIVIDVQNDFCPGGALTVHEGDAVVAPINALAPKFEHVIVTQDWHPAGHISFAASHPGSEVFDVVRTATGKNQTLWPIHCVQGTQGAQLHPNLKLPKVELHIKKGQRTWVDSYSAFVENDRVTPTGLETHLLSQGVKRVFLAGLAYDFCVHFTARDARRLGFEVFVIEDGCRAVDIHDSLLETNEHFEAENITRIQSSDVA